jgi:NADPH:quinone reductase-like Zn-dependent oxidoreductase
MLALISTPDLPEPVQIREVEDPEVAEYAALIEVRAFSINRGELRLLAARPGWRPGQDVAGVVVAAAADGRGPREGARVVAAVDGGGWAQRVAAPVTRLAELPASVGFPEAATLPVAGLTALRALREAGTLLGRDLLVTGAAGGVGQFAVQLGASAGARVTAAVSSLEHGAGLTSVGATRVVSYDDLGGPFHAVLESVGGPVLEASLRSLEAGGVAVLYGSVAGEPARISLASFAGRHGVSLRSFYIYQTGVETFGQDLAFLVALMADGRLHPQIGMTTSWRSAADAIQAFSGRRVHGKVVLLVD